MGGGGWHGARGAARPPARRPSAGGSPDAGHQALAACGVVVVRRTENFAQSLLLDPDPPHQRGQGERHSDGHGNPVGEHGPRPARAASKPRYDGCRTQRYGPALTTGWPPATRTTVVNQRPSVSTAQTRMARPAATRAAPTT